MSDPFTPSQLTQALVSRTDVRPGAQAFYLILSEAGAADWTADPVRATAFASMREATRMALRLPASVRAYGLPRHTEVSVH
ncbi:MAG TPA: hypothetical protein VFE10_17760 [Phenylobacterium sp.]|jgi:hypothetical protein|nr:hypothetical protein [Phenylobacterium sp.]